MKGKKKLRGLPAGFANFRSFFVLELFVFMKKFLVNILSDSREFRKEIEIEKFFKNQ